MNNLEIYEIVETTRSVLKRMSHKTDCIPAGYDNYEDLKNRINFELNQLENNNLKYLIKVYRHYLPTSTFQVTYIDKEWETEYFDVALRMDELYARLKPRQLKKKTILENIIKYLKI